MTPRILMVALIVGSLFATLPEASEALRHPALAGGGPSAASLAPGAPHESVSPATAERAIPTPATRSGTWAYANRSHGPRYLAIPEGRGIRVAVCGPLGCLDRVSTDAGPALYLQRAGRIGDLSSVDFVTICGPLSRGLCRGTYTILEGRPRLTLPPTDSEVEP
jgi:hypothetical protein